MFNISNHVAAATAAAAKSLQSCPTLCHPTDYTVPGILQARILEWVASSFLQGIFPTQRLNPCVPNCRWLLYRLNHQGSPRILEWVPYPFSRGLSQPRNRTEVSCIAGGFFTSRVTREGPIVCCGNSMFLFAVVYPKLCFFCFVINRDMFVGNFPYSLSLPSHFL